MIERKRELDSALNILKKTARRHGAKGSRTHLETMEEVLLKRRAIENGPCNYCANLIIEIKGIGRATAVGLSCGLGKSPVQLQRDCDLGKTVECSSLNILYQAK